MNWAANDRARCIRTHPWRNAGITEIPDHETPSRGETYRVLEVMYQGGELALYLDGFAGWFAASEFVKVPPPVEAKAVNRETATIDA